MVRDIPPPPDFSNLKDHYTESHPIAFNNHFFGKKMCGKEVCTTREERDRIYNVIKNWNHYKELEADGEMTDDDLKQWRVNHRENHAGFEWVKKYSTHTLLLPSGVEKPILCHLEASKKEGKMHQRPSAGLCSAVRSVLMPFTRHID